MPLREFKYKRKPEYNVVDFFSVDGLPQAICRSKMFTGVYFTVASFYMVHIGVDVDNHDDSSIIFPAMKSVYLLFFVAALGIKLMAFKRKRHALKDMTTCLEFVLTVLLLATVIRSFYFPLSTVDTIVDLMQILRMLPLLPRLPELRALIRSLGQALKAVKNIVLFLLMLSYAFAIMLRRITAGTEAEISYFPSVPQSMSSLVYHGLFFSDVADIATQLGDEAWFGEAAFVAYIFIATITAVIALAIICEVVSSIATTDQAEMSMKHLESRLADMFALAGFDLHDLPTIPRKDARALLTGSDVSRTMETEFGLDPHQLEVFAPWAIDDNFTSIDEVFKIVANLFFNTPVTLADYLYMQRFCPQAEPKRPMDSTSKKKKTPTRGTNPSSCLPSWTPPDSEPLKKKVRAALGTSPAVQQRCSSQQLVP